MHQLAFSILPIESSCLSFCGVMNTTWVYMFLTLSLFFFKFNEIIVGYEYLFRALKNSLSKQIVKRFV